MTEPLYQLEDPTNLQKYKVAGIITTKVLDLLVSKCQPDVLIYDLCQLGDSEIIKELGKVYPNTPKGIAFPTCVSPNNCAGFYSPLPEDKTKIKKGDLVKIELGTHIDGYPALVCYTVLVSSCDENSKQARVLQACIEASRKVASAIKPKITNVKISEIIQDIAKKYACALPLTQNIELAPATLSYQISRYVIDGFTEDEAEHIHQFIMPREGSYEYTQSCVELEEDEVYSIDIAMCSGTGKLNLNIAPTTVFKRLTENRSDLKLASSKQFLNSLPRDRMAISLANKFDAKIKLGLKECITKKLVSEYPVLYEKEGEYVARIKFTIIIRKSPILISARSAEEQLKKIVKN